MKLYGTILYFCIELLQFHDHSTPPSQANCKGLLPQETIGCSMELIRSCAIGSTHSFMNWNANKMACITNGGLSLVHMNCNCSTFLIFVEFGAGHGVVVLIRLKGPGWVFA